MEEVDISYYDLKGHDLHMSLAPGDLIKICNVLHDYTDLLVTLAELNGDDESKRFTNAFYMDYVNRLKKIQGKIETTLGYKVEKAIEKCNKRRLKKDSDQDIGEDALVLAVKARANKAKDEKSETKAEKSETKDSKDREIEGQISLFG